MSNSPTFGNNNFTLDGFMDQGRPVNMRITGWLSTRKEDNDNPQKLAVIEQIKQLILDNDISIYCIYEVKVGDDYKNFPKIGRAPLFPNKPKQETAAVCSTANAATILCAAINSTFSTGSTWL